MRFLILVDRSPNWPLIPQFCPLYSQIRHYSYIISLISLVTCCVVRVSIISIHYFKRPRHYSAHYSAHKNQTALVYKPRLQHNIQASTIHITIAATKVEQTVSSFSVQQLGIDFATFVVKSFYVWCFYFCVVLCCVVLFCSVLISRVIVSHHLSPSSTVQ